MSVTHLNAASKTRFRACSTCTAHSQAPLCPKGSGKKTWACPTRGGRVLRGFRPRFARTASRPFARSRLRFRRPDTREYMEAQRDFTLFPGECRRSQFYPTLHVLHTSSAEPARCSKCSAITSGVSRPCTIHATRKELGNFRMERIDRVVARFFLTCGDYRQGVARIRCVNPECRHEYFRPFSCKGFFLCPSCSQKRTLLFAEYLDEQLLFALPHPGSSSSLCPRP